MDDHDRATRSTRRALWALAAVVVVAPFLLVVGTWPEDAVGPLERGLLGGLGLGVRVAVLTGLSVVLAIACARRRYGWPLLALLALVLTAPAAYALELDRRFPCWRTSNAAWCGHFCDDDPCTCAERATRRDPYGAGTGCAE